MKWFTRVRAGQSRVQAVLALFLFAATVRGAALSPLGARGYHAVPEPQRVTLRDRDFEFGPGWRLEIGSQVRPDDVAVQ